jgi:6-phosphogluconolactonase (cycloisomerase 2 family)
MAMKTSIFARVVHAFVFLFALAIADSYAQSTFVYVNNVIAPPHTVSAFSVNANGSLTEIAGSPFMTFGSGSGTGQFLSINPIACAKAGNLLFVANDPDITVFRINQVTGVLSLVPGSPFPTGLPGGYSLAASPDGRFLFASLIRVTDGFIVAFSVSPDGTLTLIPGSPFPTPFGPFRVQVSGDNRFLSVGFPFADRIGIYRIAPDGTPIPAPGSPFHIGAISSADFNCSGDLLFAAETGGPTRVHVFRVANDGGLSPIPGSPFVGPGASSESLVLSPDERHLFVNSIGNNSVIAFSVAVNGSLSLVSGSPFPTGIEGFEHAPTQVAINETGTFLSVSNRGGTVPGVPGSVSVFSVASNGVLTLAAGSPFSTGQPGDLISLTAYPPKTCLPTPSFDICIQDDSNGSLIKINSISGEYRFMTCSGFNLEGIGTLITKGGIITLQHYAGDRRVLARIDTGVNRGTASVQTFSPSSTFTISDRNTGNNSCACAGG